MDEFNMQNHEFWKWGIIYFNPSDPSIWIEKRIGFGWTLNFAHKQSWFIVFMIIAIPVIILVFTVLG